MTEPHWTSDVADFLEAAEDIFDTIAEHDTPVEVLNAVNALTPQMCRAIVHAHALTAYGERVK